MKVVFSCIKDAIGTAKLPGPPPTNLYQPTCVFLLVFNRQEPSILAIQKSESEGYTWSNQVALPGGHVDKNDSSSVNAAFRELEEEMSIPRNQVELIGSMGHFQTVKRKDIEVFIGLWNGEGPIRHDAKEISRSLKIPLAELYRIHKVNNYNGRVPEVCDLLYPFEDVVIWGATARILHYFLDLLFPFLEQKGFAEQ